MLSSVESLRRLGKLLAGDRPLDFSGVGSVTVKTGMLGDLICLEEKNMLSHIISIVSIHVQIFNEAH